MMERVALSAGRCGSECVEYSLENTKFIAGELSLIVSLALYRPTSVYEL